MSFAVPRLALHCCTGSILLLGVCSLQAGTNGFVVPLFRGAPSTQFGFWETFTIGSGAPGNLADQAASTSAAVLTQSETNAFVTGSGNIYNVSHLSSFTLTDATPFPLGTVVLQTRTIGSELDYNSVVLTYTNDSGTQTLAPALHYELDRAASQGFSVSTLFQWDLKDPAVSNYAISFAAAGHSLSFDSMTLDTSAEYAEAFEGQPFDLPGAVADLARWMYPFNADPAGRGTASVFGALGSTGSFDSRDAQFLLGWNTSNNIPSGLGATNYLLRRASVTLTIASGNQYTYTGAPRDYRTYFPASDPRHIPPSTTSAPVELFGAGFRAGFTPATFPQDAPFYATAGAGNYTNRSAYPAGFDPAGALIDVSNNVGDDETNEIAAPFEVAPFGVGKSPDVAEGELMPVGSRLQFDLNLEDPLIYGYLQDALNDGRLMLTAVSLVGATLGGPPTYPTFYTSFSIIAAPEQKPLLELEGVVVRPELDSDADGLPDDWENFYFNSLAHSSTSDPDGDHASNRSEFAAGTDPSDSASALRLLSMSHQAASTELSFSAVPNRALAVRVSNDLQTWNEVTGSGLTFTSDWLRKTGTNVTYPSPVYGLWRETNEPESNRFYSITAETAE